MPRDVPVALVGGRGYVGQTLLRLLQQHPHLTLACAASRSLAGRSITSLVPEFTSKQQFENLMPTEVLAHQPKVIVLALANGESEAWVKAIDESGSSDIAIVDASADHRFNETWTYGLTEHHHDSLRRATRIANPGCYATAMQLALRPIADDIVGVPACFGVSGYSGAGTRPSPKNDESKLRDNLMPYQLCNHIHEREVTRHLGTPISFTPHVAPFFSGISMTVHARVCAATDAESLHGLYQTFYAADPLIHVLAPPDIPEVRANANRPHAAIGGWAVNEGDPTQLALVCTIDNLLKGAASQIIQNINLTQGWASTEGLT